MTMLAALVRYVGLFAAMFSLIGVGTLAAQPSSSGVTFTAEADELMFQIDAQPIREALKEFASRTNLQLIYEPTEISPNIRCSNVEGSFTPKEALSRLLAHTNLNYKIINYRTVSIRSAGDAHHSARESNLAALPDNSSETSAPTEQGVGVGSRAARRSDLEVVLVTAEKREESVVDVPISIVAVGTDELQKRQINSLEDIASAVPNVFAIRSGNNYFYEIRGVSNEAGSIPLIGLYIDEADVTVGGNTGTQINPVTYDLERVEVLRGPQGTLYGDGSAGGTIRLITKSPNLDKFAFDTEVTAFFTEGGDPSQRINAVVNVPLIDNQLGLRIAGTFEHEGGWIDQPAANQDNINGENLTNVRIKGLWKPDPNLAVSAMAIINRSDRGADFSDVGSPHTFTQVLGLSTTPRTRNDYELLNLTTTYDLLSTVRILNTLSYLDVSAPLRNAAGTSGQFSPPGNPPSDGVTTFASIGEYLLTDELRLTSVGTGPWQWTVGGFFRHFRDGVNAPVSYYGTPSGILGQYSVSITSLYTSWSVFGDGSYQLTSRLRVGAGARYFGEKQDFTDFIQVLQDSGRFHSIDPRAYAQFKLTPDVSIYASAAKGFRSGGFNAYLPDKPNFEPESLWTYELGAKMVLLEGRINLDTALYTSDYKDYQVFGLLPGGIFSYNANAGEARIKGVEGNLTWQALPGWRLEGRGAYVNGRFTTINATETAFQVGDPLDHVPRYQFTLSGEHEFSLHGQPGFIRVDFSQQGPETYRNRSIGPWVYAKSGVVPLLGFNAGLQLRENLRVGFFVQNLLDDQHFNSTAYFYSNGIRARPRTFGIEFGANFE